MDRRSFLKGCGVALGALSVGKLPTFPHKQTIKVGVDCSSIPDTVSVALYGHSEKGMVQLCCGDFHISERSSVDVANFIKHWQIHKLYLERNKHG